MHSLTILDWIALAVFAGCWFGYSTLVDRHPALRARSVIAAMDEHRRRWLQTTVTRDNRIMDTQIIGNLMNSTVLPGQYRHLHPGRPGGDDGQPGPRRPGLRRPALRHAARMRRPGR